jgi:hypothetical protein
MPANSDPIYSKQGNAANIGIWTSSLTANTTSDGTGTIATNMVKIFTAGVNGAKIDRIRLFPAASVAATPTTATVARLYTSTITSGATTRADTIPFAEIACPAQTADQTTTAVSPLEIPCGFVLPANQTILMSMHHAAAANTSWAATVWGGDY